MTFPQTPLDVTVELNLGGTWTDITGYVFDRASDFIQITRGRQDWAAQTERSVARLTLDNADGRFSPENPTSPYYGMLGRNTPLRIQATPGPVFLDVPGDSGDEATAPDSATLGITGDIDVRIDVTSTDWSARDLCGKYDATGDQRSWTLQVGTGGHLVLSWSTAGTSATRTAVTSTAPVPLYPSPGRLAVRATLDVNNGAGGNTATFYTSDAISGTWTQLGAPVVTAGTTSIFDSTSALEVADVEALSSILDSFDDSRPLEGAVHAFELRNGIGGTVVANPDFTAQAKGAASFADTSGTPITWTVAGQAMITDGRDRFHGEVSEWPVSWDASGTDVYTPIEASGILRRLGQGSSPLRSTMFRGLVSLTDNPPVAYWPMEDADNSTQFASGLGGGTPAAMTGSPDLAASTLFACSDSVPVLGTGGLNGAVPAYTATGESQIRWLIHVPTSGPTDGAIIARITTTGTASRWDLRYNTGSGGSFTILVYDSDGTLIHTSSVSTFHADEVLRMTLNLEQNGSDIDYAKWFMVAGEFAAVGSTGTVTGRTFGRITNVKINPTGDLGGVTFGHLSVHPQVTSIFDLQDELAAYVGEEAGRRFQRLCTEEGITCRSIGDLDATAAMGAQTPATLLVLLLECVEADLGLMYEPREALGLGYRTRKSLYSQAARIALDYGAAEMAGPLGAVKDDQLTRNDITATRKGGSSYRVEVTEGPLSVNDPEDGGVGRYPDTPTVNLELDEHLRHHVGWLAHLGTADEARYPSLEVNLAADSVAANTDLTAALLDFELGDRLTVDNPPAWMPPDQISQLVQGYTETMRNFEHRMTLTGSPEVPWRGAVYDVDRYDTAGSTLAASIGTVSTVAFVADAESNNTTAGTSCAVSVPAGTRREDVMVALIGKIDQAAITPPAGWTLIGSQLAGSNVIYEAYYRVAQASEPASYSWSWGVAAKNIGWIGSYRNVDTAAPVATSASSGSSTPGTTFSTPVPSAVVAGVSIIRSVFERHPFTGAANTWTISGGTERMDLGSNGGSGQDDSHAVYDNTASVGGTPTVRTLTASQTVNQTAMWTIALAPAAAMDISVTTTSGPPWTYRGIDLPMNITIGGEEMTVDLVGDVLNTNPYFTLDLSDWSVTSATSIARSTAVVHPAGVASMLITPNGVSTTGGALAGLSGVGTVVAGQSYIASGWVNIPTGYTDVRMAVDWYDAAGVFLSSGLDGQFSAAAGIWTPLTCTLVAPASASQARLRVRLGTTPPATALTYVWNAQFIDVTDSATSPQRMRVIRNVNGIVKAQTAGAAVSLTDPVVYAL